MPGNPDLVEKAVLATFPQDNPPEEQAVSKLVDDLSKVWPLTPEERDVLLKRLHSRLAIRMEMGTALVKQGHRPWLNARKPQIEPFYASRYQSHLMQLGRVRAVINTTDRITDDILDLCGDPQLAGAWKRRGLVMGDVQAGKTGTYTELCCKAADAGYRLIILLTGTLEILRRQTQERLDEGFIGLDSSGFLSTERMRRLIGVGLLDQSRTGVTFTSYERDFRTTLVNQLGFRLGAFKEPILLVVKKNYRILQNLENWLRDYNAGQDGQIATPLLLIDDEADNASVNTRGAEDPTKINERIRALLKLFHRSTYVGFTATPFANIFIDPDSTAEMLGDDLFPSDFIYSLEPPTNYVGPEALFSEDRGDDTILDIEDAEAYFPLGHKPDYAVEGLPDSLIEAIRSFVIANAIRDIRGEGPTHRSMLVNVSRFTNVQMQVAGLIEDVLRNIQRDIRAYSRLPAAEAARNQTIAGLAATWEREYSGGAPDWPTVKDALVQAALPIVVRAVNQRTGAASLNYAEHREHGLRVIAVGGNSLSRGLTLYGLTTSYFFRNSQMYDTLLQMGRWFGYRDGYADLCRLWLTEEAQHWYAHITEATAELRAEIGRMRAAGLSPAEFGLKVRAHPDSLIVTARNKMRSSKVIERVISVSGEGLETPHLWADVDKIRNNATAVREFIREIEAAGAVRGQSLVGSGNQLWRGVPRSAVARLLRIFDVHPLNVVFQGKGLAEFLDTDAYAALENWDVVLPNGSEPHMGLLPGLACRAQLRQVTKPSQNDILVSGKSARVGSRGSEREGIAPDVVKRVEQEYRQQHPEKKSVPDWAYREARECPLLLLHNLAPYRLLENDARENVDTGGKPLFGLGLSFPRFDDSGARPRVTYRVNLVEWRNLFASEEDDEEEADDEAA